MIDLTVEEIIGACGGRLVAGDLDRVVTGVSIDSRVIKRGDLFVPIRGERFDGHDFLGAALEVGAGVFLVEKGWEGAARAGFDGVPAASGLTLIVVEQTSEAFGQISSLVRQKSQALVAAVTGSTGKTCTKDMLAAILSGSLQTVAAVGNHNNEIGVPLTLLGATPKTEAIVVELAMRGRGQIAALAEWVRPDIGIITNIGLAHIEILGSVEAIAEAKGELAAALPKTGHLIVDVGDPWAGYLAEQSVAEVTTFGFDAQADFSVSEMTFDDMARPTWRLVIKGQPGPIVRLSVPGRHNVLNALAALAGAHHFGISMTAAAERIAGAEFSEMRLNVFQTGTGITVIDDVYNANPTSMAGALDTLVRIKPTTRHIAVVGWMAELGVVSEREHSLIGTQAADLSVDMLIGIGVETDVATLVESAVRAGRPAGTYKHFDTKKRALTWLQANLRSGDTVLVKASRVVGLEDVVAGLRGEG